MAIYTKPDLRSAAFEDRGVRKGRGPGCSVDRDSFADGRSIPVLEPAREICVSAFPEDPEEWCDNCRKRRGVIPMD